LLLLICLASTSATSGSGFLWFVLLISLLISASALVLFLLDANEALMETVAQGSLPWPVFEMAYSSVLALLSIVAIWLSFRSATHTDIHSTGYVAAALFFVLHAVLYASPAVLLYDELRQAKREGEGEYTQLHPDLPFYEHQHQSQSRYQSADN